MGKARTFFMKGHVLLRVGEMLVVRISFVAVKLFFLAEDFSPNGQ